MKANQATDLLDALIEAYGHGVVVALTAAQFRRDCENNAPEDGGWNVDSVEDHRDWAHDFLECVEEELF